MIISLPASDFFISNYIVQQGKYEPTETEFLKNNLKVGQSVLNVGAHVGIFASLISKLVGPTGKVIAIEPSARNFKLLKVNLKRNGDRNWKIYNFAAGSSNFNGTLYVNQKNSGDHRLFDPSISAVGGTLKFQGFRRRMTALVKVVKLDDVLVEDLFDFILIDAQGWDHDVILGMRNVLIKSMPIGLFEFVPGWLEARGISPEKTLDYYRELGYNYRVLEFNEKINMPYPEILKMMGQLELLLCQHRLIH